MDIVKKERYLETLGERTNNNSVRKLRYVHDTLMKRSRFLARDCNVYAFGLLAKRGGGGEEEEERKQRARERDWNTSRNTSYRLQYLELTTVN